MLMPLQCDTVRHKGKESTHLARVLSYCGASHVIPKTSKQIESDFSTWHYTATLSAVPDAASTRSLFGITGPARCGLSPQGFVCIQSSSPSQSSFETLRPRTSTVTKACHNHWVLCRALSGCLLPHLRPPDCSLGSLAEITFELELFSRVSLRYLLAGEY